jgi:hypothetical protein
MNAILRGCNRADSVYFGSFCIRSRSHMSWVTCSSCIRDQARFADAYHGKLLDKRDPSEKRTRDLRSRGGGLNDSTKTDWSASKRTQGAMRWLRPQAFEELKTIHAA